MSASDSGRGRRSTRALTPTLEGLDQRVVLSASLGPSLGSFLAPGVTIPAVSGTSAVVGPVATVESVVSNQLDFDFNTIPATSRAQAASTANLVSTRVYNQPLIRFLLGRQDTYTLLTSAVTDWDGAAGTSYSDAGPILESALATASKKPGPNAPTASRG